MQLVLERAYVTLSPYFIDPLLQQANHNHPNVLNWEKSIAAR